MLHFSILDDTLSLLRQDRCLYQLRVGDAPIRVGRGENTFSMTRGSFTIREKIASEKPLVVREISLRGETARIRFDDGFALLSVSGDRLHVSFSGLESCNRMWLTLPAKITEHVYGTGETFSEFDLRGQKVNVWVAEHQNAKMLARKKLKIKFGLTIADFKQKFSNYETYYAQPTFLSSRRYYFHSRTTARCVFDFTKPDCHVLKTDSVDDFYIGFGDIKDNGGLDFVTGAGGYGHYLIFLAAPAANGG